MAVNLNTVMDEPTMPAEAVQALFKCSNGNVVMKARVGHGGWERALFCDECRKLQSVDALLLLAKSEEEAFQKMLAFCAEHRHEPFTRNVVVNSMETVQENTGRRIKEI